MKSSNLTPEEGRLADYIQFDAEDIAVQSIEEFDAAMNQGREARLPGLISGQIKRRRSDDDAKHPQPERWDGMS